MGSSIKRLRYRYDARGNRKALIDQDGGRFTYSYDAVSRITQVINPQGDRTSYSYDAAGRRTVKKLANGTRASFAYDNVGNLTRLANLKSDGTTISSFNYDYDRVGNRTAVLEVDGSRVTWSYDDTYQLTGEDRTGSNPYRDTYVYDAAGNRLLKIHDGARTTTVYDAANQIRWSEDASGRTSYTFDADGNQTGVEKPNGDRTTMSWDFENRTTLVEEGSGIRNTMMYEPGGLRVKLEESTGVKKFVWDEENYLAETDENDDTQVVYTNEPRVYGNLVSQRRGTDSHWYHFDAIGSTRELTNDAEAVTDTRLYDAWGGFLATSGGSICNMTYSAETEYYIDQESKAYYVRARRYIPGCGRWISADPFTLSATLDAGISYQILGNWQQYAYAYNKPVNHRDPSGLFPDCCCPGGSWKGVSTINFSFSVLFGKWLAAIRLDCTENRNIVDVQCDMRSFGIQAGGALLGGLLTRAIDAPCASYFDTPGTGFILVGSLTGVVRAGAWGVNLDTGATMVGVGAGAGISLRRLLRRLLKAPVQSAYTWGTCTVTQAVCPDGICDDNEECIEDPEEACIEAHEMTCVC